MLVQRFGYSARHPLTILSIYHILAMNVQTLVDDNGRKGLDLDVIRCMELAGWLQDD